MNLFEKYQDAIHRGSPVLDNCPWIALNDGGFAYEACFVHWLTPAENGSKHNVYVDVLDENGQQRYGITDMTIAWRWNFQRPDEASPPIRFDKRRPEPAANLPIWAGQRLTLWLQNSSGAQVSQSVGNLHTDMEDSRPGNSRFHHSYYVVFRPRTEIVVPPPSGLWISPEKLTAILHHIDVICDSARSLEALLLDKPTESPYFYVFGVAPTNTPAQPTTCSLAITDNPGGLL